MSATEPDEWLAELRGFQGRSVTEGFAALDDVNRAMIRHFCEAVGDTNPRYAEVAPPAMLQVWTMRGFRPPPKDRPSVQDELWAHLDARGFTSVVATESEQEYLRYLRPGDRLTMSQTIESISGEKQTALGRGHFVTMLYEYRDQRGEPVGTNRFTMLKFEPRPRSTPKALRPRPAVTRDTAFWFDAAGEGRLVIQRCAACGVLRHPPGPSCPSCLSLEWDTVDASGKGTVFSFVVVHHPQVPAFHYPLVVAVIELEEGTRLVSNVVGCAPDDVRIGMAVECEMVAFDDEVTLPQFRPAVEA